MMIWLKTPTVIYLASMTTDFSPIPQWRKVKTADRNKFILVVDDEYKNMPDAAFVFNHKGEQLFFYTYHPDEIPIYPSYDHGLKVPYAINWGGDFTSYNARGMDCEGVPTFTHHTSLNIATFNSDIHAFEPLTVGVVKMWLGWFLYRLENNSLKIGL